jgi:hypothetical protein
MRIGKCIVCGNGTPGSDTACFNTKKCEEINTYIADLEEKAIDADSKLECVRSVVLDIEDDYQLNKKFSEELIQRLWDSVKPEYRFSRESYIKRRHAYLSACFIGRKLFAKPNQSSMLPNSFIERLKLFKKELEKVDIAEGFDKDKKYGTYYPLSPEEAVLLA